MTFRYSIVIFAFVILGVFLAARQQQVKPQSKSTFNGFALVDKTGNIRKPVDYRDHYEILGTWMVLDPKGNQMHYTYASPGAAEYYRKNGKFADGTVLVKEIDKTDHAQLTTGDAHWATAEFVQWFVMIKDDKHRFPNNALWGDGWGWALFKPDAPDKQVATDHSKDCIPCHVPAKSTDWTYVQGYPVLKSAK